MTSGASGEESASEALRNDGYSRLRSERMRMRTRTAHAALSCRWIILLCGVCLGQGLVPMSWTLVAGVGSETVKPLSGNDLPPIQIGPNVGSPHANLFDIYCDGGLPSLCYSFNPFGIFSAQAVSTQRADNTSIRLTITRYMTSTADTLDIWCDSARTNLCFPFKPDGTFVFSGNIRPMEQLVNPPLPVCVSTEERQPQRSSRVLRCSSNTDLQILRKDWAKPTTRAHVNFDRPEPAF